MKNTVEVKVIFAVFALVFIVSCIRVVFLFNEGLFQSYRKEMEEYKNSYNSAIRMAEECPSDLIKQRYIAAADHYLDIYSKASRCINKVYFESVVVSVIAFTSLVLCWFCFGRLRPLLNNNEHYNYD